MIFGGAKATTLSISYETDRCFTADWPVGAWLPRLAVQQIHDWLSIMQIRRLILHYRRFRALRNVRNVAEAMSTDAFIPVRDKQTVALLASVLRARTIVETNCRIPKFFGKARKRLARKLILPCVVALFTLTGSLTVTSGLLTECSGITREGTEIDPIFAYVPPREV